MHIYSTRLQCKHDNANRRKITEKNLMLMQIAYYIVFIQEKNVDVLQVKEPFSGTGYKLRYTMSHLIGQAVTRSSLEREVHRLNLRPVKLDTVLPTVRHR